MSYRKKHSHRPIWPVALGAAALSLCLSVALGGRSACTYTITDGQEIIVHTSSAESLDEVLLEAGITLDSDDLVSATGGSTRAQIVITRNQDVSIAYGGSHLSASTYGSTVGTLLNQLNLDLASSDTVICDGELISADTETYDGMALEITKTTTETQVASVSVPYDTITYQDPTLESGATRVETQGRNGTNQITLCLTYVNGVLSETDVVDTRVLSAPVNEVVYVGTLETVSENEAALEIYQEPEAVPEEEPEADSKEETQAPTVSQTTEETTTVSTPDPEPEPEPEPTYSSNTLTTADGRTLTYSATLSVTATAYTGGGTTATGTAARYGAIAVDPSVIPYGTKMYIVTDDGSWIYGEATAEDCGGAIQGNIIDLYFDSYSTCIQFGRRSCTVYILD